MSKLRAWFCLAAALLLSCVSVSTAQEAGGKKISFKKTEIERVFRSEGAAVGDFNKDGKLDISAGSVWFAAPDWKKHDVLDKAKEFNPAGYSDTFCNFADDVNGDGWTDLLVVDFPGKSTWWFENPKGAEGPWKRHECISVTNNESPLFVDVDGDGKRELVLGYSPDPKQGDGPDRKMAIIRRSEEAGKPWKIQDVSAKGGHSTQRFSHGLGIGDINKDGKNDVLVPQGWWENPGTATDVAEWKFHNAPFGPACAHMLVNDYDGDGDNDVLTSSAHQFGIWWFEQTPEGWKQHEIDKSFSQTHALVQADINGDGLPDFVTGKRWWAHGAKGDPGSDQPAVMYWFELQRTKEGPKWIPHVFDHNSGIGTQFEVADVNGDGLLDVVTSNKQGTFYFQQVRE